jgi:hypothetical protein
MWPLFSLEDTEFHQLSFITLSTLQSTTSKSSTEEKRGRFPANHQAIFTSRKGIEEAINFTGFFCAELRSFFATETVQGVRQS